MLTPCEIAVKCVLPAVRAMIAKDMMKKGLRQVDVANLLGVSQSAVSLYGRKIRGRAINLEEEEDIVAMIGDVSSSLYDGNMGYKDFITKFCELCRVIRGKGLMCELHKVFDPTVDPENCDLCSVVALKC